jgi:hypothetical protein
MRQVFRSDGAPSILGLLLLSERAALTAFLRGRFCGKRSGHAMASADYFPSRPKGRFTSRSKIAGSPHPPLCFGRFAALRGAGPVRPPPFVAMKAAMSATNPTKGSRHDDRAQRDRLRAAARHIPDRSRPHRTPTSRLNDLPSATAARPRPKPPIRRRRKSGTNALALPGFRPATGG